MKPPATRRYGVTPYPPAMVTIDARARTAFGLPAALPAGTFVILPTGEVIRIHACGCAAPLVDARPHGKSVAASVCPGARRAR